MDQSRRMLVLRVKIDSWSEGVDRAIRQRNRDFLNKIYLRLPPPRVWLYFKRVRLMQVSDMSSQDISQIENGLEDVLAEGE